MRRVTNHREKTSPEGIEIPLFRTKAERLAAADERPSLEELYTSNDDYVSKITAAANELRQQRLLLDEDVSRIIAEAENGQLFCEPDDTTLCLGNRRFQVTVTWRDFRGRTGDGRVVPGANETSGTFWFFSPDNWELLVKVLDGCSYNGHIWFFAAGATTVELNLTVTDTQTGQTKTYTNPLGVAAPAITDASAFATCGPGWDLDQGKSLEQDLSGYMESKR